MLACTVNFLLAFSFSYDTCIAGVIRQEGSNVYWLSVYMRFSILESAVSLCIYQR